MDKKLKLILYIIIPLIIILGIVLILIFNKNSKNPENLKSIPKIIHKCNFDHMDDHMDNHMDLNKLPKQIMSALNSWIKNNKNYLIKYYTLSDAREYIKKHFEDTDYLQTFECLVPMSFKSNFFRYILLYIEGGWYSEWEQECLENNLLDKLDINKKQNIVIFDDFDNLENDLENDSTNSSLQNNFIGIIPKHQFMKKLINEIINNVKQQYIPYKNISLISGPRLLHKINSKEKKIKSSGVFRDNYLFFNKYPIIKNKCQRNKGNIDLNKFWKNKKIYNKFIHKDKIPKIIIKTGPQSRNNLDENLVELFQNTIDNNPDFKIEYFDNEDCYNFIKENFNDEILETYENLIPSAYKADLFRYCALYIKGGIYSDLTQQFLEKIDNIIDFEKNSLVLTEDYIHPPYEYEGIQISFIATIPKQPLIKKCIDKIIYNVKENLKGDTPLDTTGPYLFKNVLNHFNVNYLIKLYQSDGYLIDNLKNKIIKTKLENHKNILYNKFNKPYYELWKNGIIFNKRIAIILTLHSREKFMKIYLENIEKWLESKYNIYIVDSNDKFKEQFKKFEIYPNYHQLIFDQLKIPVFKNNLTSSSVLETESLKLLFKTYDFSNYNLILKITCKYFFDLHKLLDNIKIQKNTIYLQRKGKNDNWCNSEVYGAGYKVFCEILKSYKKERFIENHLAIVKNNYNIVRFPEIELKSELVPRGAGDILESL